MIRTAGELAEYLGAKIEGDSRAQVSGVAAPERAQASDLIYLDSPRHQERAANSAATCVIVKTGARLAWQDDSGSQRAEIRIREGGSLAVAGTCAGRRKSIRQLLLLLE